MLRVGDLSLHLTTTTKNVYLGKMKLMKGMSKASVKERTSLGRPDGEGWSLPHTQASETPDTNFTTIRLLPGGRLYADDEITDK